jgi:hypothetical protein
MPERAKALVNAGSDTKNASNSVGTTMTLLATCRGYFVGNGDRSESIVCLESIVDADHESVVHRNDARCSHQQLPPTLDFGIFWPALTTTMDKYSDRAIDRTQAVVYN